MRKKYIVGNWKMNGSCESTARLLEGIKQGFHPIEGVEVGICPPFVFLEQTQQALGNTDVHWGAQTLNEHEKGAYTGEIAGNMLVDFGCRYVIIGHSERRQYYHETNTVVLAKLLAAVKIGLKPILCVGESLEDYNRGNTKQIISDQLNILFNTSNDFKLLESIIIAYEPVWAIGTGLAATPEQAQAVHRFIRGHLKEIDQEAALSLSIIYGGSVKPENASALFSMPDIDGGLIGGASLQPGDFLDIISACKI